LTDDLKILSVRFTQPVEIKGMGMLCLLNLGSDAETKKPFNEGVSATWVAAARAVRVVTKAGETWVPEGSVGSLQPLYEVRANSVPIAKRNAK
jgi:hypothetical protein